MAKINCVLKISLTNCSESNGCGWLFTDSKKLFDEIISLGCHTSRNWHNGENSFCEIREPEGSDKLANLRKVLTDSGLKEYNMTVIPLSERKTHFSFRYEREFTKKDLDGFEYLRLNVNGAQRMAEFSDRLGMDYIIKANKRLNNNIDIGWLDKIIVPYVSEAGKRLLQDESYNGIEFRPAIYDKEVNISRRLFQLYSSIVLPPCLTAIKNSYGEIVDTDGNYGERVWDDFGCIQPVLKYRRKDIIALGDFDIARTREYLGSLPKHHKYQLVVSQRFRQFILANKFKSFDFVPILLVE